MTLSPALAAINAAESRLDESRRNLHQSVDRTRSALSAAIARPSTLVLVAVASGISGFLLAPRVRASVKGAPKGADSTIKAASRSLGRLFVSMFGAQVLSFALELGATAWAKSGLGGNANMPSASANGAAATAEPVSRHV